MSRVRFPSPAPAFARFPPSRYALRQTSKIRHGVLRDGLGAGVREERVWIVGADLLVHGAFRLARQLRDAIDRHLAHGRLVLAEALDPAPRHRKGAWILDADIRFQHLAV